VSSQRRRWSPDVASRFAADFPERSGSHSTFVIGYSWSASAILTKSYGEFGPSSADLSPRGLNAKTCNFESVQTISKSVTLLTDSSRNEPSAIAPPWVKFA
jgi:hypothetical protein